MLITFKRGLSFLFNSPKPLKIETPLALAANKKHKINSSIAKGTIDEEHFIDDPNFPQWAKDLLAKDEEDMTDEEEEKLLLNTNAWIRENGLPDGELEFQLTDEEGNELALFDLAWPHGLQEGLSNPVALLINEGVETLSAAGSAGFLYFTDVDSFKNYVQSDILAKDLESSTV